MTDAITEQIAWWRDEGFTPWLAHEALYGRSPWVMTWNRLAERMHQDFGKHRKKPEVCKEAFPDFDDLEGEWR